MEYSFTLIYLRTVLFDLELQIIFKMAAKFTLTLSILQVNQHYYTQKIKQLKIKNNVEVIKLYYNILEDNIFIKNQKRSSKRTF